VPHAGVAYFLIVAIIVVGHDCNALRMLLAPLLAALGTLLGILDGDVRHCLLVAAWGHLPAAWVGQSSAASSPVVYWEVTLCSPLWCT
jgi:hypothetical protein